MLKVVGQRDFAGPVGEALSQEFTVHLSDGAGAALAGHAVVFQCDPPGAVLFEGKPYAIVTTEDGATKGRARARGTIQHPGAFVVRAETNPNDADHTVTFSVTHTDGPQVHRAGGNTIVTPGRTALAPPPRPRGPMGWPAAAGIIAVLAAIVLITALAMFRGGSSSHGGGPIGPVAAADDVARRAADTARLEAERATAAAEAARRDVQAAKEDLTGELAANSATDQSYAAQRADLGVHDHVYDAEALARYLRGGEKREARRLLCIGNPLLPTCRDLRLASGP